jgi:RNA polymerase sigma factor (sigma-70 family)
MENTELERIAEDYGRKISGLARRMIRNAEIAKDAAQEVWFEIVKSIGSYKGDSHISTWIYTIAKRTILRHIENERLILSGEINDHFAKPEIVFGGDEDSRREWIKEKCDYCLTAFCNCVAPESRLVFLLSEFVGLENDRIAQIMETNETNIRKIQSRAKHKVRNFMSKNCILYNQDASCRCRIKKEIIILDFHKEYENLRKTKELIDFYLKFEENYPRKNFWLSLLPDVTK